MQSMAGAGVCRCAGPAYESVGIPACCSTLQHIPHTWGGHPLHPGRVVCTSGSEAPPPSPLDPAGPPGVHCCFHAIASCTQNHHEVPAAASAHQLTMRGLTDAATRAGAVQHSMCLKCFQTYGLLFLPSLWLWHCVHAHRTICQKTRTHPQHPAHR